MAVILCLFAVSIMFWAKSEYESIPKLARFGSNRWITKKFHTGVKDTNLLHGNE